MSAGVPPPATDRAPESDRRPGSYAVLLVPEHSGEVSIGRLGRLRLDAGCFVYIGSALGPGGVAARCRHHLRIAVRPHWHLDYLRPHCRILGIWGAHGRERLEHRWALALGRSAEARWPLPRFGASDCRCPAHLVWLPEAPTGEHLRTVLGGGSMLGEGVVRHERDPGTVP